MGNLNPGVTRFLDDSLHTVRKEIETLRKIILSADGNITENIKWNGPNYCYDNEDRITMRIHPAKQIQLVFHRGAKKLTQPDKKLIDDPSKLLIWKENDRAIVSFKDMSGIIKYKTELKEIVGAWINATKAAVKKP